MQLQRLFGFTLTNIIRNPLLVLATVVVMAIVVFVFNIIVMVNFLAASSIEDLNQKLDMRVELQDQVDLIAVEQLKKDLKVRPEIAKVIYISREDAFADFEKKFPDKAKFLKLYGYQNPLPASLILKTRNAKDHQAVRDFLSQIKYENVIILGSAAEDSDLQKVAEKLANLTASVRNIIFWVITVFILGGFLIIFNTVHLTIFQRRREISIMRLVGASLNFIRLPLVLEGALFGGVSVILGASLFLFFLFYTGLSSVANFSSQFDFLPFFFWQLLAGVTLGVTSSYLTTEKYLKGKIF